MTHYTGNHSLNPILSLFSFSSPLFFPASQSSDVHSKPADPSQEGVDLVISVTQGHQKENPDKTINLSGKTQQLSLEALYIKHAKH
ncbi:hypothetical protein NGA_0381600, partial [Nannochloropsis gaditana CCMP526]|uniref:uncharacterized protein n=1 Tax=Nannochloropsis gaditana (strain CCMP526) TaxID=1093141 RepID=UPI00029F7AF9